jgi:hypothetical protein
MSAGWRTVSLEVSAMDVSALRKLLIDNVSAGSWTDLHGRVDLEVDVLPPVDESDESCVPASVLAEILCQDPPRTTRVPKVRIRNATIVDDLDLEYARVTMPLILENCRLAGVNLEQARVVDLWMTGCRISAAEPPADESIFSAAQLEADFNVSLRETRVDGSLSFIGAKVGHQLNLGGLRASAWKAGGGAPDDGQVRLVPDERELLTLEGVDVGASLFLNSATLHHPAGTALEGFGLRVAQASVFSGLRSAGRVALESAHLEGAVYLSGVSLMRRTEDGQPIRSGWSMEPALITDRLVAPATVSLTSDEQVSTTIEGVHLIGATIGRLELDSTTEIADPIDMRGARVVRIEDAGFEWPGELALDGLTYDELPNLSDERTLESRKDWMAKATRARGYRPKVYNQLATAYRQAGLDDYAREILVAKEKARAEAIIKTRTDNKDFAATPRNLVTHAWDWFVRSSTGYGYRAHRILYWMVPTWLLAWIVFASLEPAHIRPKTTKGEAGQQFVAGLYSLDHVLPVASLGQRTAFVTEGWPTSVVSAAFTLAGWLLSLLLVAGLSGVFKRD